jgi:glycosyltransferase involved in cell wall biosynthesis
MSPKPPCFAEFINSFSAKLGGFGDIRWETKKSTIMRIALLSTVYPLRGGIAQFNAALYRELEKTHDVRAFTFTRQYPSLLFPGETQYVTETDNADPIPSVEILDSINPISYFRTAQRIRDFKPDLLLTKFWMPFFAPSLGYVSGKLRKCGTKTITMLDNVIPHEPRIGDRQLLRYFLDRTDGFIAMSEIVKNDLLKLKPGAKYALTPHPVYAHFGEPVDSDEARQKLGIPGDKNVLLFFGFIRKYKGLDILIQALEDLPESYLLVVAGEMYGDFAEYKKFIDATGTAAKIKLFVRYIDDDEVPLFFSAADVAVLPYKSATQSGIAQIARHFHLPLIVTDAGGLAEMVEEGKTGLVVRTLDSRKIAERIAFYFDSDLKARFSSAIAGQSHKYTWVGFVEAILALYAQI